MLPSLRLRLLLLSLRRLLRRLSRSDESSSLLPLSSYRRRLPREGISPPRRTAAAERRRRPRERDSRKKIYEKTVFFFIFRPSAFSTAQKKTKMRKPQPPGRPAGGGFGSGGGGARTTHSQLLTVLSFLACLYVAGRCGGGEEREREREGEGMESMGVGGDDWFFLLGLFSLTLPPLSLIQIQTRTHLRTQQALLHQPGAVVYGTWIERDVFSLFLVFSKRRCREPISLGTLSTFSAFRSPCLHRLLLSLSAPRHLRC